MRLSPVAQAYRAYERVNRGPDKRSAIGRRLWSYL